MRIRLGLGALATAIALLLLGAIASACDSVSGVISPSSARAGDPISFSISGLLKGATYRVSVDGLPEASGVSDGASVSGSFPMPDYGSESRTVYVEAWATHTEDNFDQPVASRGVQYLPPPSVAPASPSHSSATSHPAPAHHRTKKPKKPKLAVVTHAAQREQHHSTGTGAAVGAAPADSVGSQPVSGDRGSGGGAQSNSESSSVPNRVLDAVGSTTSMGPAKVPTIGLLLMAVIFVVGTGLAALVIYISQNGPDPQAAIKAPAPLGHDPVEVELQELIADQMARQLLSDLDLAEPPVSSS
jgi:hypothetical protein